MINETDLLRIMVRSKKIKSIFIIYWLMLLYILAALVWWYVALEQQNKEMTGLRLSKLNENDPAFVISQKAILIAEQRKSTQYIGEGSIFLLLVLAAAVFIYRAVNRELKQSRQQQNFMMAITHELKTPISVSKLNLETLQKRKLDEAQQQRLIQNTLEETNRLNLLCNNLLISSQLEGRVHRFAPGEFNFSDLLEDIVRDYRSRYPDRKFNTAIEPGILLYADTFMMQMVFSNLLDNACKYSPKNEPIEINAGIKNENIWAAVSDKGNGIPVEERENIFNKFYRMGNEATRKAKGTGLGLYLVKRLLTVHKASILVNSNQPHGTTFAVHFKKQG